MLSGSGGKSVAKEKGKHTRDEHCMGACFLEILPLDFLHFHRKLM